MGEPAADLSVRVAWAGDAEAIAAVQLRVWREVYGELAPATTTDALTGFAEAWRVSLERPGDARNRVLVALDRHRVVGFAMTVPAADPDCDPLADAELMELSVDPSERARGHGSRLLHAAVDTMRADQFRRAVTWVTGADDTARGFLADAGWVPDTAHRELASDDVPPVTRRQVRLHTGLE